MYLVYFVGSDPGNPSVQRPIGQLRWSWGSTVDFEWAGSINQGIFNRSNDTTGYQTGVPTTTMVTMNGNVKPVQPKQCPGGPGFTNYKIDSTRSFIRRHYLDFLGREPDDSGFDFWTAQISHCGYDLACTHAERVRVGYSFFISGEFVATDPDLWYGPGNPFFDPNVYNRKFVYWCYMKYLQRDPTDPNHYDMDGWNFWTNDLNQTGDYYHIIDAFQLSDEYRNRLGNGPN